MGSYHQVYRTAEVVVTSREAAAAGERPASNAAAAAASLRHPRPQLEACPHQAALPPPPAKPGAEKQLERVVGVLLRELSETRREKALKDAQLAAYKDECLELLRSGGGAQPTGQQQRKSKPGAPVLAAAAAAFRPPGIAPPPTTQNGRAAAALEKQQKQQERAAAEAAAALDVAAAQQAEALRSTQLDNATLRRQLAGLETTCMELQARVGSPPRAEQRRPASPGAACALVLSSPRHHEGECDLMVALFEPPSADAEDLRRQLNKLQRENLKLSSKHKAAEAELTTRSITAKRWKQACEAQGAQVAELQVQLEQERRANAQLQRTVARVGDECSARDEDVSALLAQLRSAEQAAAAAAGEAAALRAQLAQVEGLLAARDEECAALKGQLNSTVARLQALELVRRSAEREQGALAAANEQLQAALAQAEQRVEGEALELRGAMATLEAKLRSEEQRSATLQAQLALVEAQGQQTEQMLGEQLRTVQEERNACLAAATRADALLLKLGAHAVGLAGGC